MATIRFAYQPSATTYVTFEYMPDSGAATIWNALTAALEAYSGANWTSSKYCIAATAPGSPSTYQVSVPAISATPAAPKSLLVKAFAQAGASPATTDRIIGLGSFQWDGTDAEVDVTPEPDPERTTGYITCYGSDGQTVGAGEVTIYVRLLSTHGHSVGLSHYDEDISATSDANGLVELPGMLREARYKAKRGDGGWTQPFTTADATTSPLPEVLGHE